MTRIHTYTVAVRVHDRNPDTALASLLDMLRYDGARVTSWDKNPQPERGGSLWLVELASDTAPALDRWASFGITVWDTIEDARHVLITSKGA